MADVHKRRTNSTYGKFGQKTTQLKREIMSRHEAEQRRIEGNVKPIGEDLIMVETRENSPKRFRNWFTAAQITAHARVRLTDTIQAIIKRNGIESVKYCDNDAVFVDDNADIRGIIEVGKEFSKWKIAGAYDEIEFLTEKLFRFSQGGKTGMKKKGILGKYEIDGDLIREVRDTKTPINNLKTLDDFTEFKDSLITHHIHKYRRDTKALLQFNINDIRTGK